MPCLGKEYKWPHEDVSCVCALGLCCTRNQKSPGCYRHSIVSQTGELRVLLQHLSNSCNYFCLFSVMFHDRIHYAVFAGLKHTVQLRLAQSCDPPASASTPGLELVKEWIR